MSNDDDIECKRTENEADTRTVIFFIYLYIQTFNLYLHPSIQSILPLLDKPTWTYAVGRGMAVAVKGCGIRFHIKTALRVMIDIWIIVLWMVSTMETKVVLLCYAKDLSVDVNTFPLILVFVTPTGVEHIEVKMWSSAMVWENGSIDIYPFISVEARCGAENTDSISIQPVLSHLTFIPVPRCNAIGMEQCWFKDSKRDKRLFFLARAIMSWFQNDFGSAGQQNLILSPLPFYHSRPSLVVSSTRQPRLWSLYCWFS